MAAGDIVHVEFPSADADRAQRFWGELFGWSFEDWGPDYVAFSDSRIGGGGFSKASPTGSSPPSSAPRAAAASSVRTASGATAGTQITFLIG